MQNRNENNTNNVQETTVNNAPATPVVNAPNVNAPNVNATGFAQLADRFFRYAFSIRDDMHTLSPEPTPVNSPENSPPPSPRTPRMFV